MSTGFRKIIAFSLKLLALTVAVAVSLIIFGVFIFPAYVLHDSADKGSLVSEIATIRHAAILSCNNEGRLRTPMPESQRFNYFIMGDGRITSLYISLKKEAKPAPEIHAKQAEYIDRKLDDGFPRSGKVKLWQAEACITQKKSGYCHL